MRVEHIKKVAILRRNQYTYLQTLNGVDQAVRGIVDLGSVFSRRFIEAHETAMFGYHFLSLNKSGPCVPGNPPKKFQQ